MKKLMAIDILLEPDQTLMGNARTVNAFRSASIR
jgi:hypothetical protein